MKIKVFHLNIQCGGQDVPEASTNTGLLYPISNYINDQKFDIVCLQEVAGEFGIFNGKFFKRNGFDCHKHFINNLNGKDGELFSFYTITDIPGSYQGVAIYYDKNKFKVIDTKKIYTCEKNTIRTSVFNDWFNNPVGFLALKLKDIVNGFDFWIISAHLTWNTVPYKDTENQRKYAKVMADFLKSLKEPFIATVDTNVEWYTPTIKQFETSDILNLAKKYNLKNTLNPNQTRHYKAIFIQDPISSKKGGVACDNIFISKNFKETQFAVDKTDLSDHYGLRSEFELVE